MLIRLNTFGGIAPKMQPKLLPNTMATQAVNCKLWAGDLRPYFAPQLVVDSNGDPIPLFKAQTGTVRSLFRANATPEEEDWEGEFYHGTGITTFARAPPPGDSEWTTLIAGESAPNDGLPPRITDNTQQPGPDFPSLWDTLGLPVPDVIGVNATVAGEPDDGATLTEDGVSRDYVIAYVNNRGQLGPTSDPIIVTSEWLPGQTVEITGLPIGAVPGFTITSKRIYRLAQGSAVRYFVDEIPSTQTDYTDDLDEIQLGEAAPSVAYESPPSDMNCIGVAANGIAYGASKNQVCLSEPFLPHAWNPLGRETLQYDVVAIGHFGTNIVAATAENPYLIYGTRPGSMVQRKMNINQGCLSKQGLVSGIFGVTYPCKDGLVLVNQGGNPIVTEEYFSRDEWAYLQPRSLNAALYADRYMAFFDGLPAGEGLPLGLGTSIEVALEPFVDATQGGFILDPRKSNQGLVMTDEYGTALYSDPLARSLFFVKDGQLWQWDADLENLMTYRWQSKEYVYPQHVGFNFGRVLAESYENLSVEFYQDYSLVHTQAVTSRDPFPMANGGQKGRAFHFRIVGTDTVSEVAFATSPREFRGNG